MNWIGIEVGGSNTRYVVVSNASEVLFFGTAAGANSETDRFTDPNSALDQVLKHLERLELLGEDWHGAVSFAEWPPPALPETLRSRMTVLNDAEAAFRSGSERPNGSLLIAGTGAIACRMQAYEVVRTCDGFGWDLGDHGSGMRFGQDTIRAVARHIDLRRPEDPLVTQTLSLLTNQSGVSFAKPREAIGNLNQVLTGSLKSRIATFAIPLDEAYAAGSAMAKAIVEIGTSALIESPSAITDSSTEDIVLAGGIAGNPLSSIGAALRTKIAHEYPTAALHLVRHGLIGTLRVASENRISAQRISAQLGEREPVKIHESLR
jgi:glucosamine kinase